MMSHLACSFTTQLCVQLITFKNQRNPDGCCLSCPHSRLLCPNSTKHTTVTSSEVTWLDPNVATAQMVDFNVATAQMKDPNEATAQMVDPDVEPLQMADPDVATAQMADCLLNGVQV